MEYGLSFMCSHLGKYLHYYNKYIFFKNHLRHLGLLYIKKPQDNGGVENANCIQYLIHSHKLHYVYYTYIFIFDSRRRAMQYIDYLCNHLCVLILSLNIFSEEKVNLVGTFEISNLKIHGSF